MEWIKIESVEDIAVKGEEVLVWDGCQCHIDFVEVCVDTGGFYMANNTEPTHWMPLPEPPNGQ